MVLSGVALAQGDQGDKQLTSLQLMSNSVLVITPDGRVSIRSDVPSDVLAEAMKDAKPMTTAGITFMRDNKLYMVPDRPMTGGNRPPSEAIMRPAGNPEAYGPRASFLT